jgi:hypothetical protein
MSLLLFQLDPESVIVATDTLATRVDGRPYLLVSKCAVLPHLGSVIAFTGTAAIGQRWAAAAVQTNLLCRDFDMLDQHTPENLRRIASEVDEEYGPISGSSTIYHFGYSDIDTQYAGYASERLHIGGDLVSTVLVEGSIRVSTIHRFADFDTQWQAMNDSLRDDSEGPTT